MPRQVPTPFRGAIEHGEWAYRYFQLWLARSRGYAVASLVSTALS